MNTKNEKIEVLIPNVDGTAIAERVIVTIPLEWDEELKEWLLTAEAHQIIEDTKARHMGLLLPAQLKELRERYDYAQNKMSELFQAGEKSWTRWESGKHRPSRSINLLICALYDGEISIDYLLKRAGKPPHEVAELDIVEKEPNWLQQSSQSPEIVYSVNGQVAYRSKGGGKICFTDAIHNKSNQQASFPVEKCPVAQKPIAIPNIVRGECEKFKLKSA